MTVHSIPHPVGRVHSPVKLSSRFWTGKRLTFAQLTAAAVTATAICAAMGHPIPWFAPIAAVASVQAIRATHRRGLWLALYGAMLGVLGGMSLNPDLSVRPAAMDTLVGTIVGAAVAIGVVSLMMPRDPVTLLIDSLEPVLTRAAASTRAVATALRDNDVRAGAQAVYTLNGVEPELERLNGVVRQIRRSSLVTQWSTGHDLTEYIQGVREISYVMRHIRELAWHSWWGILHQSEPVPTVLPQMLESLADAIAVLRDELSDEGQVRKARPLLIAAARWSDILRTQHLSISAAAVVASANSAVHNLLIATGVSVHDVDHVLRS